MPGERSWVYACRATHEPGASECSAGSAPPRGLSVRGWFLSERVVERVGAYPSPTVLVDGVDVMTPGAPLIANACRLDLPIRERVLAALNDARRR